MACVSVDRMNPCVETGRERTVSALRQASKGVFFFFIKRADSHSLFVLDGSHPRINIFVFEFFNGLSMNFEVDGIPVFWIVAVVDPLVRGRDLSVIGLEDWVFEEEAECRHLGNHHPPGAVHLVS